MNQELYGYLFGDATPMKWLSIGILANVMVYIMISNRVKTRDVISPNTPTKFSWKWFIADNISSILRTQLSIFAFSRVALVWVAPQYVVIFAFATGLISDQLPVIFGFAKEKIIIKVTETITSWIGGKKKETVTEITKKETP